jgi:hypothetical protein
LVGLRCNNNDPPTLSVPANEIARATRVDDSWLLFFFVGLLAQLVDGALGMAFGVTATTVMLRDAYPGERPLISHPGS